MYGSSTGECTVKTILFSEPCHLHITFFVLIDPSREAGFIVVKKFVCDYNVLSQGAVRSLHL